MKCANCDTDALFEYQITAKTSTYYCGKHLPKFLDERRRAGLLKITPAFTKAEDSAFKSVSPAPTEQLIDEPIEEPKPVKKAVKKKAK